MAGDDCDSFLAEHRSQRVGTFAAAADVVGIDAIGDLGGYPDRGAPVAPLGAQDDVGGEYAVLLLERDAAVVGGLRDRFGEVRARGGSTMSLIRDQRDSRHLRYQRGAFRGTLPYGRRFAHDDEVFAKLAHVIVNASDLAPQTVYIRIEDCMHAMFSS